MISLFLGNLFKIAVSCFCIFVLVEIIKLFLSFPLNCGNTTGNGLDRNFESLKCSISQNMSQYLSKGILEGI